MNEIVDVLIIGSGASGAAVAWSLAETRMRILCLEQGDWMKPTDYPTNGRDWEARQYGDFAISPNIRARPTDYPINDDDSPIKVVNFNGVGGSTIMYTGHFPRLHPSDFRVRSLDGVADDWPVDYATLDPFFAENDRMMGVSGLAGDPAYPPRQPPMPPLAAGQMRHPFRAGAEPAWLALVAVRHDDCDHRLRWTGAGASISAIARRGARRAPRRAPTSPIGRTPSAPASSCARAAGCARSPRMRDGMASGVVYYDAEGVEQFQPAEVVIVACNGVGTPRLLLNSASARFPDGLANSSGLVGRNLMFHPWASGARLRRRAARRQPGAAAVPVEQAVLRDRSRRAISSAATPCSSAAAPAWSRKRSPARRWGAFPGARDTTAPSVV